MTDPANAESVSPLALNVAQTQAKNDAYAVFAGSIDQAAVQRIFNSLTSAMAGNITHVHLLFQSTGGFVGDGVCLYNFFKAFPIPLTLYNVGSVQSIATLAFLGANKRKTSAHATFMMHRSHSSPQMATAASLDSIANGLRMDDERTEAILRNCLTIPNDKWDSHKYSDIWFTSKEAVQVGIASEIGEFSPPAGSRIYNV